MYSLIQEIDAIFIHSPEDGGVRAHLNAHIQNTISVPYERFDYDEETFQYHGAYVDPYTFKRLERMSVSATLYYMESCSKKDINTFKLKHPEVECEVIEAGN